MTAIPEIVVKLIPRLAPDHDGEVVATVRAIGRSLRGADLDWHDLAGHIRAGPALRNNWRDVLTFCVRQSRRLNARERAFVKSIAEWNGELSEKQLKWLLDIRARLGDAE